MRSLRRVLAVLAVTALVVTGCGDDDDEPTADDTTDGDDGTDLGLPDLSGETVEVAAVWSGAEQERFEMVLDEFASQTGARVTFTSTGDDIAAALRPRIQAGEPPDVAMLPQPGLLRDFHEAGALQPIDDVVGEQASEFSDYWREFGTVDGTLYGLWFKAANKSTIWYNTAIFEDAGVEPPEDWDGLLDTAQTISDFGVDPLAVGGADGWVLTDIFENVYLRTAGAEMYDQLATHEIPWTHESVIEALTTMGELLNDDVLTGGLQGALETEFPNSVTQAFGQNPAAAMVFEGDFVAGVISSDTDAEVGTDADYFPFPDIDGSDPAVVSGGDVAVLLADSEGGRALMQFLATPEAAEIWAAEGGFLSLNAGVDTEVYPTEIAQRLATELVEAEMLRFDLSDLQPSEFGATPGQGMWAILQNFLDNPDDVEGTAQQLEQAAARAYG